jgi:hypothetical protein
MYHNYDSNVHSYGQRSLFALVSIAAASFIMLILSTSFTSAQSQNFNIFPVDSRPYNLTYGEWSARWWIWALSVPEENNPITDQTGENCDINQQGPVWFLAGTLGGSVTRECSIPPGKAILLSPLNIECSYAEFPAMKTEKELRDCAQWPGASVEVTIDGVNIQEIDKYNVQSPIFDVVLPENNIFGAPAGPTKAVSGGWWVLLEPLQPGKHQISFGGSVVDNPTTGTQGFAVEATYSLNVQ